MWNPIILDVECIVCNKTLHKINHNPHVLLKDMGKISNNSRRSRTPNWSADEKQYLLELIKDRKDVIVTKSNNGPNHSDEKDLAWNDILSELATRFGNKFVGSSIKKVKTQWQNMKRIAREEISLHGAAVQTYSRQSLEVSHILDLVKDGELVKEPEQHSSNQHIFNTNIEIKTERIEEEDKLHSLTESCEPMEITVSQQNTSNKTHKTQFQSPSTSEQFSTAYDYEELEEVVPLAQIKICKTNAQTMTDDSLNKINLSNPFHKHLQEFFRISATEKQLKLETLKEERQVIRAMRETAELNKITAEQKLKHVLWIKKQEMLPMSSSEHFGQRL